MEKSGYFPGALVGLGIGAVIFLAIAFMTARW